MKVHNILQNENYVGNSVVQPHVPVSGTKAGKKPTGSLGTQRKNCRAHRRSRSFWAGAADHGRAIHHVMSDEEMLRGLRVVLKRKGKLSFGIINEAPAIPSAACYVKHFGSLRKIYALAGYRSQRNCDWIDTRAFWSGVLTTHTTKVAEALNACKGIDAVVDENSRSVTVNGTGIFFFTARQLTKPNPTYLPQWRVYCRRALSGLLVLIRLDDTAREIEDYLILPASEMTWHNNRFSPIAMHGATRVDTVTE